MIELYKGWEIRNTSEISNNSFVATSPDYDVDCDIDGFYVCSGCILTADSIAELKELIDEYILENEDETV
jgi:hypothetical protein